MQAEHFSKSLGVIALAQGPLSLETYLQPATLLRCPAFLVGCILLSAQSDVSSP
jgi:hypothetical protein